MNDDVDADVVSFEAGTPISTLIADKVIALPVTATVREAAKLLNEAGVGLLVIGDSDNAQAVISERDIVKAVAAGLEFDAHPAIEAGSSELLWASHDASVGEVLEKMMEGYLRHILIRDDDGGLAGVVSMRDLVGTVPLFQPDAPPT